ncbi:MAG TPA: RNA polymerase sigma factor [Pyrinomonadaceae bacterium]|nr:RNA polymerase sigma factor [Pyrinomonadaceae bacterium]
MLKPRLIGPAASHEEIFVQRYDLMLRWALRLTGQQHEQAEDLVHDCFIQLTVSCDPASISNIEGYLYAMLKNLHLARIRQAAQFQDNTLSVVDYDSAELSLQAVDDIRARMQVQDDLRKVCQYASLRKATSKAGSVLILRFFHGYYPAEIALILRSSRQGVEKRLKLARSEAKLYLDDPVRLKFLAEALAEPKPVPVETNRTGRGETTIDFLRELRQMIFQARPGNCPSLTKLKEIYLAAEAAPTEASDLAHIVSCIGCLEQVNNLLGLAPLNDRYPTDMLGPDTQSRDDDGGPKGSGGAGGSSGGNARTRLALKRYRRGVKQVIEHSPKELRIAVNGFLLGSQRVGSELSGQTLSVKGEERIGFVEIFSEQRVRLLFLSVEPPPDGEAEQASSVALSEGRTLDVALRFGTPWPTLHVVYHDPSVQAQNAVQPLATEDFAEDLISQQTTIDAEQRETFSKTFLKPLLAFLPRIAGQKFSLGFWLRPASVTGIVAALLIAVAVFIALHERLSAPTTVTELLARSAAAEDAAAAKPDQVLHRTINLEERSGTGNLIAQRRIEVWQSAERGVTARRLYDEKGQLVAGDWRRANGVQTIYHHGARPQLQLSKQGAVRPTFENVWQFSPSAKDFAALISNQNASTLEERSGVYIITYERAAAAPSASGLVNATLILSKADLHPTELTLVVASDLTADSQNANRQSAIGNRQWRQYRFIEMSYERRPTGAVAPAVFEPEPELSGRDAETRRHGDTEIMPASPRLTGTGSSAIATADLEVEVLRLLNQVGADLNDQTSVTRTPEGKLRIGGLADTDQRKREILRVLAPVVNNPSVMIQIETLDEAVRRQAKARSASGSVTVERAQIAQERIPVYEDLRRHFGENGGQADEEIGQFATRILSRSRQAMSRAGAMKRLAQRFSSEDLRAMSPKAREKWLSVIRSHSRAFEQETRMIRQELQPIFFPPGAGAAPAEIEITDEASLVRAVERLFELGAANDDAIRSAFAISADGAASSAVKTARFWRSLLGAEKLAGQIGKQ